MSISQTTEIVDPTVDLFIYDLIDGLGILPEDKKENRKRFWQRLYQETLPLELENWQASETSFAYFVDLLGDRKILKFTNPHRGYYYPVKLDDTYGLQISCSGPEDDPQWQQLSSFDKLSELKALVISQNYTQQRPRKIGQSWLLWGKLAQTTQDPKTTAQACYNAVQVYSNPNWNRDYQGEGTFREAWLYELEQPDFQADGLNQNHHVLICLFPATLVEEEVNDAIQQLRRSLMSLFYYRNKTLWVYEKTRQLKEELKKELNDIEQLIKALPGTISNQRLDLKQLQQDLTTALTHSHGYEIRLSYMNDYLGKIKVSTRNHKIIVDRLAQKHPSSNLDFLNEFVQFSKPHYIVQIKTDYENLQPGLNSLQVFIKRIAEIIEIEKSNNERTLNATVVIASVAIGAAAVAATLMPNLTEASIFSSSWLNFAIAFSISILIGVNFAILTWGIRAIIVNKQGKKY